MEPRHWAIKVVATRVSESGRVEIWRSADRVRARCLRPPAACLPVDGSARYLRTCTELAAYDGLGGSISRGASEAEVQDYLTRSRQGDAWLTDPVEIDAYDQAVRDYAAGKCP